VDKKYEYVQIKVGLDFTSPILVT